MYTKNNNLKIYYNKFIFMLIILYYTRNKLYKLLYFNKYIYKYKSIFINFISEQDSYIILNL